MLFTDNNLATAELLHQLDPEVQAVVDAVSKGRDRSPLLLDGAPGSVCWRAWAECRSKLESALASFNTYWGTAGMQSHLAAVLNFSWYGQGTRARLRLNQIVTSDTFYANSLSPLQQWVTYSALRLLFQSASIHFASANTKGDRYEQKEKMYERRQAELWRQVMNQGMPYVLAPLDCPGAIHGYQAGLWDASCLSFSSDQSNTNADDQNVRVAITYYDSSQYVSPAVQNNGQSGPSAIVETTIPAGQLLNVSIAGLNPPDKNNPPNVGLSQGVMPMLSGTHWQVWAGTQDYGAPMFLQVSSIPVATKTATLPATLVTSGVQMGQGQVPDPSSNLLMGNIITRG